MKTKSQITHISTKKDIETKRGSNLEAVGATSCVFQSQQNNEGRERESESSPQEEPSSDGPEGDQGSSDSYQNTKSFESQNTPVPSVVQEKRVTIKDMIDSQKLSGKKRKRTRKSDITSITTKSDRVDDESKIESPKPVIPQKKIIFVNGKAQIDQSSLLIEESHFRREEDDPKYFKVINDDEYSTSNALIYPKKSKTKKWSEEETDFFFKSVEEWGTDFTMIESKFNGTRSRAQIKNKFKKEEKVNPEKVDAAFARTYTQRYAKKRDIKEREKQIEVVQTS
ncbi:unnamed protein product [Moneuplotes crassus]|uniref:Myb-like domain-containing protein n=1 Tax=Euplotes crassus TaxID=5936 RepID=A0AAD2CYG6_EUPCR|nr:unnamed protein product [Moneuplotes crassus]